MKNNEKNRINPYIDIHSHILPQIDDGSEDFLTSMKMLKMASEEGIREMILTPHNKPGRHNAGPEKIASLIKALQTKADEEGFNIKLYPGNELYYRSGLPEMIAKEEVCTMADSDYVLTEFNPMDDYDYIRNGIYDLTAEGYSPILAHVERYSKVCAKMGRIEDLIEMGCYIQVNTDSIMGNFGLGCKMLVKKILSAHLVHFIATDAHDTGKRAPKLAECASYIKRKYGKTYMRELFYENPLHVIRNEYIKSIPGRNAF